MNLLPQSRIVVIGASAGGVSALQKLLGDLPADFPWPIVCVLHLPQVTSVEPTLVFQRNTRLKVVEIEDKLPIEMGSVYFAPPGYHTSIEEEEIFSLSQDEPVNFSRPSIDILFETAANIFGNRACGILLTGANADGAKGLKCLRAAGAWTLVQDPLDAEISFMPQEALKLEPEHLKSNLKDIAKRLCHYVEAQP